jgi:hypothetical protein
MEKADKNLKDFVEGLELTILNNEDSILLDGMVGTSGASNTGCNTDHNCSPNCGSTIDNCHAGNCYAGCGVKP